MGQTIEITAEDGHVLDAYRADPEGAAKGAVVVVQEIFGVNVHIRDICDRLAAEGYTAIAPAVFDRLRKGVEYDYDAAGVAAGRELVEELGWDGPVRDVWAAAKAVRPDGRVGVTGFCWGGSVVWLAACRLDVACAASYYGRHVPDMLDETPRCPTILHFGGHDPLIPMENIEKVKMAFPDLPVYVYDDAGHGFHCDRRPDYREGSAKLAWGRTLDLFAANPA